MGNDFHSGVSRIIHFLPPKHLILDFKRFRYVLIPGKLLYQAGEHLLCLPVNVGYGKLFSLQRCRCSDTAFFTPFVMISNDSFGRPPPELNPKTEPLTQRAAHGGRYTVQRGRSASESTKGGIR